MTEQQQDCAARVIAIFPALMQALVSKVEGKGERRLSFQQFRALMFIGQHSQPHLSMVREHLCTSLSAASKLIDGLIQEGLVGARTASGDRRVKLLSLTPSGRRRIQAQHRELVAFLDTRLEGLTDSERLMVALAMDVLQSVLAPTLEPPPGRDAMK